MLPNSSSGNTEQDIPIYYLVTVSVYLDYSKLYNLEVGILNLKVATPVIISHNITTQQRAMQVYWAIIFLP